MYLSRKALAHIGVLVALLLGLGVSGGPVSAQDYPSGLIPEGDWTEDQIQFMLDKIDETHTVLPDRFPEVATYEDLETELGALGFHNFGATAPGGYDHWINQDWLNDDHVINPEYAESLVYQQLDDGTWKLVSAMYMLSFDIGMDDIPEDIAFLPGWHVHPELCVDPADGTFAGVTDPENPDCPEGTIQSLGSPMMHIWLEDPGCGHLFGGVGVGGLHCEHGDHGDHGEHGDDHDGGHDHGDDHGDDHDHGDGPPPAPAVPGSPNFTG